jgi:hypothetical protein
MSSVGQELLDVPLPEMVAKLAMGIATAQHALDQNSIETAEALAKTKIKVVPSVVEKIEADGKVTYPDVPEVEMTLIQVGLNPTFYQFSESTIEVTMDIKTTSSEETAIKATAEAKVGWGVWSASINVEASFNRKFGKEVNGTSKLLVKLVPVPPPPRLIPPVEVVDERNKKPS